MGVTKNYLRKIIMNTIKVHVNMNSIIIMILIMTEFVVNYTLSSRELKATGPGNYKQVKIS